MKRHLVAISLVAILAGCTTAEVEPVPGSITYGGQPRSRIMKAPVGSTVHNELTDQFGRKAEETYVIQPDRSLKLVSRRWLDPLF